jgi:hypothetical protein
MMITVSHLIQKRMKNFNSNSKSLNLRPMLVGTRTGVLHKEGTGVFTFLSNP